jgi:hypothetical protein
MTAVLIEGEWLYVIIVVEEKQGSMVMVLYKFLWMQNLVLVFIQVFYFRIF